MFNTNESHEEGELALSRETTDGLKSILGLLGNVDDEQLSSELLSWFKEHSDDIAARVDEPDMDLDPGEDDESNPEDDLADMELDGPEMGSKEPSDDEQEEDDFMMLDEPPKKGQSAKSKSSSGSKKSSDKPKSKSSPEKKPEKEEKPSKAPKMENVWRALAKI